jgi:hypothetical protein
LLSQGRHEELISGKPVPDSQVGHTHTHASCTHTHTHTHNTQHAGSTARHPVRGQHGALRPPGKSTYTRSTHPATRTHTQPPTPPAWSPGPFCGQHDQRGGYPTQRISFTTTTSTYSTFTSGEDDGHHGFHGRSQCQGRRHYARYPLRQGNPTTHPPHSHTHTPTHPHTRARTHTQRFYEYTIGLFLRDGAHRFEFSRQYAVAFPGNTRTHPHATTHRHTRTRTRARRHVHAYTQAHTHTHTRQPQVQLLLYSTLGLQRRHHHRRHE